MPYHGLAARFFVVLPDVPVSGGTPPLPKDVLVAPQFWQFWVRSCRHPCAGGVVFLHCISYYLIFLFNVYFLSSGQECEHHESRGQRNFSLVPGYVL